MSGFEFPAFLKLEHQPNGSAKSAFLAEVDGITAGAKQQFEQLEGQIDPVVAANQRLGASVDVLNTAMVQGLVTDERYAEVLDQLTTRFAIEAEGARRGTTAHGAVTNSLGAMRYASIQAGQQLQDIAISLYAGQRAGTVFAEQIPQLAFVLTGLEGSSNKTLSGIGKFATFLSGPWGLAIGLGVGVLGTLAYEFLQTGSAIDEEVEKLKKNADQSEITRQAKEKFGKTEEGVRQAILDQRDALDKQDKALGTAADQALATAKANLANEVSIRSATKALLDQAIAQEQAANKNLAKSGGGSDADAEAAFGYAREPRQRMGRRLGIAPGGAVTPLTRYGGQLRWRSWLGRRLGEEGEAVMISATTLAQVAAAIDELDFSAENASIAEIEARQALEGSARARVDERISVIARRLMERQIERASLRFRDERGREIADALVAGETVVRALAVGPKDAELDEERDTLHLALADLRKRGAGDDADLFQIKQGAFARLSPVLAPLAAELVKEAEEAVERLVRCHASLSAVGSAGQIYYPELAALNEALHDLRESRIFTVPAAVDVPMEIQEVLSGLGSKGASLPVHLPEQSIFQAIFRHPMVITVPAPPAPASEMAAPRRR